jgi:transmembrane sensor
MRSDDPIGIEAGHWLLRLQVEELDSQSEAFLEWLTQSAEHLRVFMETFATYRMLGNMDPQRLINVETLLKSIDADVIRLCNAKTTVPVAATPYAPRRRRLAAVAAVAAVLAIAIGARIYFHAAGPQNYLTAIGEQRTCKLEDGSIVYLNTDTQMAVRFSATERHIELERGEALFAVERDSRRPFIVDTADARIRALGTQFNVRRRAESTDVAVMEGAVEVTKVRLIAGDEARVVGQQITKRSDPKMESVLAWRARRLAFTEAPLEEVAAEFNRYNQRKIRVEGVAGVKRLTGIFDADRPAALILYAMKDESLVVEPKGDEWIIRGR